MDEIWVKVIVGVLVGAVLPYLGKAVIAVYDRLFRDLPFIKGKWKTTYRYIKDGTTEVEASEIVEVSKTGRWATGVAQMNNPVHRKWELKGELRGRYWAGRVYAADRKTLSGSGVFQLKVLENGKVMEGFMLWYDAALDKIYSTPYSWRKVDKSGT